VTSSDSSSGRHAGNSVGTEEARSEYTPCGEVVSEVGLKVGGSIMYFILKKRLGRVLDSWWVAKRNPGETGGMSRPAGARQDKVSTMPVVGVILWLPLWKGEGTCARGRDPSAEID
jgi:hypothetical protein